MPDDVGRPVTLDLGRRRRIHVVNVGGAGMSGVATILAQMGHEVSGVDVNETPFLAPLRALGVDVTVGTSGIGRSGVVDVATVDAVVTSTATPPDHPDVRAARSAGRRVLHRAEALAAICKGRQVTAVSGTHGKTTTTAMLATIAEVTGSGTGYLVATRITGLGRGVDWSSGPGFVIEADESDGTFLHLGAHHVVVTNLEADHLSHWGSEAALTEGFQRFVRAAPGTAVLCADDPGSAALVGHASHPVTYGTDAGAGVRLLDVAPAGIGVRFVLADGGRRIPVTVPAAPGVHNARNAAAALLSARAAGTDLVDGATALAEFAGVARRFEQRGTVDGITFVDSYDHLPTEVAAALAAARTGPFERVVCVFQPHRYTRTRDLADTFADAFVDADVLGVTELYPAGEEPIAGVSGRRVLDTVASAHPGADVRFLADLDAAEEWLVATLRPGDLCLTLNAGDLTTVPDRVLTRLRDGSSA